MPRNRCVTNRARSRRPRSYDGGLQPRGNLGHFSNGLKLKFSGKDPANYKGWRKQTCLILSINRNDLVGTIKGSRRPEGGITKTDESTTATQTLEQCTYEKVLQGLCTTLYLNPEKPAQFQDPKYKGDTGIGGNGQKAWQELESEFLKITYEAIRTNLAEPRARPRRLFHGSHLRRK